MAIYLQYGSVKGEVTEPAHTDWIELSDFSWSVNRNITTNVGSAASREVTNPMVNDAQCLKKTDTATIDCFKKALAGTADKAVVEFTQTIDNEARVYLVITMEETLLSAFSVSGSMETWTTETIALNFTKIEVKYIGTSSAAEAQGQLVGNFDLKTNTVG